MTLNNFDNTIETAQNLGSITGAASALLSTTDITGIPQDPLDVFRVSTSAGVSSLSFSIAMTTDLSGLSNYIQYILLTPLVGFETDEVISFYRADGDFDSGVAVGTFGNALGTSEPVSLNITPGADAVFSVVALGYDYDNPGFGGIDLGSIPGAPNVPNLPTGSVDIPNIVPIEFSLSVGPGTATGSSVGGSGGSAGGGGTGGSDSGGTVFDLAAALSAVGLANLIDFDGNSLGAVASWVEIGRTDIQGDGDLEVLMINEVLGRWATLGIREDGTIDFSANSAGGDTRVVGTYEDPLVALGQVVSGGPFDSQTRFANDIATGNLGSILGAGDYDGDGFQEVYFGLNDASAVLHAYMHADGNIRYANYQSEADLEAFMQLNSVAASVYDSWI